MKYQISLTALVLANILSTQGQADLDSPEMIKGQPMSVVLLEEYKSCDFPFKSTHFNKDGNPMFRWKVQFCPAPDQKPLQPEEVTSAYMWGRFCDGPDQ